MEWKQMFVMQFNITEEIVHVQMDIIMMVVVNVSNPFISANYQKGVNWFNNESGYDYTKVIRSDTWAKNSQLVISLTKEEIRVIQGDNDSNWNLGKTVYNGRCSLPDTLWSNADKKEIIKINPISNGIYLFIITLS